MINQPCLIDLGHLEAQQLIFILLPMFIIILLLSIMLNV